MRKGLLLAAGLLIMSCQKDAVETLQGEVVGLETTVADLQLQIDALTTTDTAVTAQLVQLGTALVGLGDIVSESANTFNSSITDLLQRVVDLELGALDISEDINDVAADVAALDIPTIEGLATEDDLAAVAADVDALGTISDDLIDLVAVVDALALEVAGVASDVVAIEPTLAVVSDFAPAFDDQDADFTQTATTTIADVFISLETRTILVTSSVVTSTETIQEAYANLADAQKGEGDDALTQGQYNADVLARTKTITTYEFRLDATEEDALYTHDVITYTKLN